MVFAQQNGRRLVEFSLEPLFQDSGIPLAVMGILVVFMALILVVAFITVLPRTLKWFFPEELAQAVPSIAREDDELTDEMLAVIAAAVDETIRKPHRIVRIRGLTPADLGWSLEGRTQQHQSHRIRRR